MDETSSIFERDVENHNEEMNMLLSELSDITYLGSNEKELNEQETIFNLRYKIKNIIKTITIINRERDDVLENTIEGLAKLDTELIKANPGITSVQMRRIEEVLDITSSKENETRCAIPNNLLFN
jgi:hypothetical protein